MPLFLIPYALQLLCVVHAIKNNKNTYWVWIVLFVPYVGGLAYILVEILPGLTGTSGVRDVRSTLIDFINPNQRFEVTKQKASYSPSYKNLIEYADMLLERKEYAEALKIYESQNAGIFKGDKELLYRIALALYYYGDYPRAMELVRGLFREDEKLLKSSRESLLYLQILEKTEDPERVKEEYRAVNQRIQNNTIELPYLAFLLAQGDHAEARRVIERIRDDERSMKIHNVRYDRRFYREVYSLERELPRKSQ